MAQGKIHSSPPPFEKTSIAQLLEVSSGVFAFLAGRFNRRRQGTLQDKAFSPAATTTPALAKHSVGQRATVSSPSLALQSEVGAQGEPGFPPLSQPSMRRASPKAKLQSSVVTPLESISFSVRASVEDVIKRITAAATAKGIDLTSLLSYEAPTPMRGDPGHLRRILITLLEAMIAVMDRGEIIVRSTLVHQTPLQATFRFSLTTLTETSPSSSHGTSGEQAPLPNLSLAKELVMLLHGEMGQEIQSDGEVTYWIAITFDKHPPKAVSTPPPRASLNGVRALIHGNLPRSLSEPFLQWGMPGHFSNETTQTLQMLMTAAQSRAAYEVVILTCQQLDPAILKLATTIRSTPALDGLRLLLLAATGKKGDARQVHHAGIDAYLTMPMTPTEVFDCVTTVLGSPARSLHSDIPLITRYTIAEGKAHRRSHILIIDPSYKDQKGEARILEELGYTADVATDGQEAALAYSQTSYVAVLLACPLPQREGLMVTAHIRQHDRLLGTHTPIIGLVASETPGKIDTLRQPGMDTVIAKPLTTGSFKIALESCHKQAPPAVSRGQNLDTSAVCDIKTALAHLDDDHELFQEMIELFLGEYRHSLAKITQAIADNDSQSLTYSANALRGALSHFHAAGAMSLALQIEQCGRKGDLSQAASLLTQLENLLPRVTSILVNTKVQLAT